MSQPPSQYERANTAHRIDGYHLGSFEAARAELIRNYRRMIECAELITESEYQDSKQRDFRP